MFIKEIFGGKSPDDFDEETLTTINKFFENNLKCIGDIPTIICPSEYASISDREAGKKHGIGYQGF